jgi:hypothetical protein
MFKFALAGVAVFAVAATPSLAQERMQEMVVVTGMRVDASDVRPTPSVYRKIRADFIMVDANFQSATRDSSERRKELEAMFDQAVKAAADTPGFAVQAGEAGSSLSPIETTLFSDIYTSRYGNSGSFTLALSIDTRPGERFSAAMERGEAFIEGLEGAGRAEAYLEDEQYIGARGTAQHRKDLLADIKAEVEAVKAQFAPADVTVTGLQSRVITQPSGPLELEIFIPYTLTVETK